MKIVWKTYREGRGNCIYNSLELLIVLILIIGHWRVKVFITMKFIFRKCVSLVQRHMKHSIIISSYVSSEFLPPNWAHMLINFFNANIPNSYIIWTYKYPRKNVKSSKRTEIVRRNLKKNIRNLNLNFSVYFRHKFSQWIF